MCPVPKPTLTNTPRDGVFAAPRDGVQKVQIRQRGSGAGTPAEPSGERRPAQRSVLPPSDTTCAVPPAEPEAPPLQERAGAFAAGTPDTEPDMDSMSDRELFEYVRAQRRRAGQSGPEAGYGMAVEPATEPKGEPMGNPYADRPEGDPWFELPLTEAPPMPPESGTPYTDGPCTAVHRYLPAKRWRELWGRVMTGQELTRGDIYPVLCEVQDVCDEAFKECRHPGRPTGRRIREEVYGRIVAHLVEEGFAVDLPTRRADGRHRIVAGLEAGGQCAVCGERRPSPTGRGEGRR